jgi:hypothetical protein
LCCLTARGASNHETKSAVSWPFLRLNLVHFKGVSDIQRIWILDSKQGYNTGATTMILSRIVPLNKCWQAKKLLYIFALTQTLLGMLICSLTEGSLKKKKKHIRHGPTKTSLLVSVC